MSRAFARGCDLVPSTIELGSYLVEREPGIIGVYSVSEHSTHLFERVDVGGFSHTWYRIGRGIEERREADLSVEGLLDWYRRVPYPLPDMVTQYKIYRRRDCAVSEAYPGSLVTAYHELVYGALSSDEQRQVYIGALLAVSPKDLFVREKSKHVSMADKIDTLMKELESYFRHDLDVRVAW